MLLALLATVVVAVVCNDVAVEDDTVDMALELAVREFVAIDDVIAISVDDGAEELVDIDWELWRVEEDKVVPPEELIEVDDVVDVEVDAFAPKPILSWLASNTV